MQNGVVFLPTMTRLGFRMGWNLLAPSGGALRHRTRGERNR
jgi:hypothetical protein